MVKVSVIVPVYNPGSNIDDCIRSLLRQTMPRDEHEIIFVDDGSTDDTPGRLDELAASHRHIRVEHIPNSGWPGRPRNVGIDLAQGRFVYFADNDDWLSAKALERLYAMALRNESDVVIGKVVGHGKAVPRALFTRNRPNAKLDWPPLLRLLTPHKLFRRSLLDGEGIRFPEGPRRLEDHLFVVHAYFHARRISVLANYPCYHWMLRDGDENASWRRFEPRDYYDNVREILDLVEEHTEAGRLRDQMLSHWYRGKMLGRVGGPQFLTREPSYRRELYEEVRRLALERYGPEVHRFLPFNLRVRSNLLRKGDYEALGALAAFEAGLRADVRVRSVTWKKDAVELELRATIESQGEPFTIESRERSRWMPPRAIRAELTGDELDMGDELHNATVQALLRSRSDGSEYLVPTRSTLVLLPASAESGIVKTPALVGATEISARTGAAGAPLRPDDWQLRALVHVAGFRITTDVERRPRRSRLARLLPRAGPRRLALSVTRDGRILRRVPLRRRLIRLVPWLRRLARLARVPSRGTRSS
jgi:poly(ribitol-phosphate) beta-N-acetylglucosaminyltransferase